VAIKNMLTQDLVAATQMVTVLYIQSQINFSRIRQLRRIAKNGLDATAPAIYKEGYFTPEFLKSLGDWHFSDPTIFSHEKRKYIAETMTKSALSEAQGSIDAASLIFAHSVLDDLATETCKVIAVADPMCWENAVVDKKISIADIRESSFDQLYRKLLDKYLNSLGRQEALTRRIDIIHQRCPPLGAFVMTEASYKYNSAKILEVDSERQEIIHRVRWDIPSSTIVADIDYMDNTCRYLIWLVVCKYELQIDLAHWFELNTAKQSNESGDNT
jgi:hypothetical protein